MRICMYTNTALPKLGGQELSIDALARQFVLQGHEPIVVAPRRPSQGTLDESSLPYPVVWHPRFCSTRWFVAWYGRWLAQLHRQRPFDVVHCHGTYPAGYVAASCAALRSVPLVITSHGDDLGPHGLYARKPDLRPRYRFALAASSSAIAISRFTSAKIHEACPEVRRVDDIPNGVDAARFATPVARPGELPAAIATSKYFLFIGRLDPQKGVDVLLHALASVADRYPINVVVAGKGPAEQDLKQLAQSLNLTDRVHFVGQVQGDLKTYLLQNSVATVVCSREYEAFGLVVLESYAAGRPVIASELPGLADLIRPNETGLRVPPENSAALAAALLQFASDPQHGLQWGENAKRLAARYEWSHIAQRHLELFEELAADQARAAA